MAVAAAKQAAVSEQTVRFSVGLDQVKFWKEGHWQMEAGELKIMVGSSSQDIRLNQTLLLR